MSRLKLPICSNFRLGKFSHKASILPNGSEKPREPTVSPSKFAKNYVEATQTSQWRWRWRASFRCLIWLRLKKTIFTSCDENWSSQLFLKKKMINPVENVLCTSSFRSEMSAYCEPGSTIDICSSFTFLMCDLTLFSLFQVWYHVFHQNM